MLFQSNLRKQIRKLPKILKFVRIIHYYSKLFTGVLRLRADEDPGVVAAEASIRQELARVRDLDGQAHCNLVIANRFTCTISEKRISLNPDDRRTALHHRNAGGKKFQGRRGHAIRRRPRLPPPS